MLCVNETPVVVLIVCDIHNIGRVIVFVAMFICVHFWFKLRLIICDYD